MKVFSRNIRFAAFLAAAGFFLTWAFPASAADRLLREVETLLQARTVSCHIEGQVLGDLMLNSRGKLTFLYVDRKLADALERLRKADSLTVRSSNVPPQIFDYAAASRRRGRSFFVARVEALKNWDFDSSMVSAGGYSPAREDVLTGVTDNPFREIKFGELKLTGGFDAYFAFFVPSEYAKPGETISLGYADYQTDWPVPR